MDITPQELFVSYSRQNKDFVRRLNESLAAHQRKAWVDWEGISATAEWMREIKAAIDGAHSFLFVISSASVASEICLQELEHAVEHRKRLIPILHEEVPRERVPAALAGIQWVLLRPSDDFAAGIRDLISAIDTDLDWVRTHTRFLLKAIEWEDGSEASSRLLRGKDLAEAERWVANSSGKEPLPTLLHSRYVMASRGAQSKRQRLTLASVTGGLLIAAGLAAFAWLQREQAVANELEANLQREEAVLQRAAADENAKRAEQQRQQAERENVRSLINGSRAYMATDQELEALVAALSAATKIRRDPELVGNTVEKHRTILALRRALFDTRERNRLQGNHRRGVSSVAFAPDGDTLYMAGGDRWISQWSVAGRELGRFETQHHGNNDGCPAIAFLAVSADGESLVVVGNEGGVSRWKTDGTAINTFNPNFAGYSEACTSIMDARVDFSKNLLILSTSNETRSWTLDGNRGPAQKHAGPIRWNDPRRVVRADGRYSAVRQRPEPIVVSAADGTELLQLPRQSSPAFSVRGDRIASIAETADNSTVHLWDLHPPALPTPGPAIPAEPDAVNVTLDGNAYAVLPYGHFKEGTGVMSQDERLVAVHVGHYGQKTEIWRLGSDPANDDATRLASFDNEQIASADFPNALSGMSFNPSGDVLATAGTDGSLKLWTLDGALTAATAAHTSYATISFSPDGLLLISSGSKSWSEDGTIKIWSPQLELLDRLGNEELDAPAPRFDTSGRFIVANKFTHPAERMIWIHDLDWLVDTACAAIGDYLQHGPLLDSERQMCASASAAAEPFWGKEQ